MNVKRDAIATFDQIIKNGLEPYDKVIEYSCDGLELPCGSNLEIILFFIFHNTTFA